MNVLIALIQLTECCQNRTNTSNVVPHL